jgi:Rrf2 family protein
MQPSRQADYAVRVVLDLALNDDARIRQIAQRQGVSPSYVGRISQLLGRAGVVRSLRGRQGGLSLAQPPQDITMLEIIEAVDGPIRLDGCLLAPEECGRERFCPAYHVGQGILRHAVTVMGSTTVADLCGTGRKAARVRSRWERAISQPR